MRKTPAGIAMNERTTGVTRPTATAQSPKRSNHASARCRVCGVRAANARATLDEKPSAVVADRPAGNRAEDVAERAGEPGRQHAQGSDSIGSPKSTTLLPANAPAATAPA